jgi:hypothetical protein
MAQIDPFLELQKAGKFYFIGNQSSRITGVSIPFMNKVTRYMPALLIYCVFILSLTLSGTSAAADKTTRK